MTTRFIYGRYGYWRLISFSGGVLVVSWEIGRFFRTGAKLLIQHFRFHSGRHRRGTERSPSRQAVFFGGSIEEDLCLLSSPRRIHTLSRHGRRQHLPTGDKQFQTAGQHHLSGCRHAKSSQRIQGWWGRQSVGIRPWNRTWGFSMTRVLTLIWNYIEVYRILPIREMLTPFFEPRIYNCITNLVLFIIHGLKNHVNPKRRPETWINLIRLSFIRSSIHLFSGDARSGGIVNPRPALRISPFDWLQSRTNRALGLRRRSTRENIRLQSAVGVALLESHREEIHVSL